MEATGGCFAYNWSIIMGSLPVGLVLDLTTGTISGVPEKGSAGEYLFTVRVTDGRGYTHDKDFLIYINEYVNVKGDIDGDGNINVIDILILNNCLIFNEECCPDSPDDLDNLCCREDICPPDEDMRWRADCNGPLGNCDGDGNWNVLDAIKIANLILQIDECL